jgi:hypothetical protein
VWWRGSTCPATSKPQCLHAAIPLYMAPAAWLLPNIKSAAPAPDRYGRARVDVVILLLRIGSRSWTTAAAGRIARLRPAP